MPSTTANWATQYRHNPTTNDTTAPSLYFYDTATCIMPSSPDIIGSSGTHPFNVEDMYVYDDALPLPKEDEHHIPIECI